MFSIMKIELPNDDDDFIIFESIKSAPAKVIHVFNIGNCTSDSSPYDDDFNQENEFKVGRSVDTDMRIADISVS